VSLNCIINIDDISNPEQKFRYDRYIGTVLHYEDRLIVSNTYSIVEYLILPEGELEEINYIEIRENWETSYINDSRYYFLDIDRDAQITRGIYVYDLTSQPMKFMKYIELSLSYITHNIFFNDDYIFVSDLIPRRSVMINKETFNVDGYVEGLHGEAIGNNHSTYRRFYGFCLQWCYIHRKKPSNSL
jgi:hypothetical protein